MKKSDLKSGMIVVLRAGMELVVIGDKICNIDNYTLLENYNEDFENKITERYDIVKVYESKVKLNNCLSSLITKTYLNERDMKLIYDADKERIDWSKVEHDTPVRITNKKGDIGCVLHFAGLNENIIDFYAGGTTSYTYNRIEGFDKDNFKFEILK